jgi:hypothetical protein
MDGQMVDRLPARLSLVHMVSRVAALRGVDHRPLLATVGLDGEDPGGHGRVVARARLSDLLTLLARRAGDEALGIELAAAADPLALVPSGAALGLGRTLGEGLAAHIRQMPSLQGGLDYALVGEGPRMRLVHRHRGGTAEESRVMNEGVAAFILRALRRMAGDENLPVHVVFPDRPRVPARIYEDRLRAAVTFRPGDGISVSFDAAHLALPNRAGPGALPARGSALSARDAEMDDVALVAALSRTFAPAAAAGRLATACRT